MIDNIHIKRRHITLVTIFYIKVLATENKKKNILKMLRLYRIIGLLHHKSCLSSCNFTDEPILIYIRIMLFLYQRVGKKQIKRKDNKNYFKHIYF